MASFYDKRSYLASRMDVIQSYVWTALAAAATVLLVYRFYQTRPKPIPTPVPTTEPPAQESPRKITRNPPMPTRVIRPPPTGHVSISKILVHPIKSCRGTSIQTARYTPEGLEHDRTWCIVDANTYVVMTARAFAKMVLITPRIELDSESPHTGVLDISFPEESECESFKIPLKPTEEVLRTWKMLDEFKVWASDPNYIDGYICENIVSTGPSPSAVISKYFGKPMYLIYKGSIPRAIKPTTNFPSLTGAAALQDGYPLLVLSEESTTMVEQELSGHIGTQGINEIWRTNKVAIERFRPNIVFRGAGPFAEDDWEEITIGSENAPPITLVSPCTRCLLPNVCPGSGERDKAVPYKVLLKFRVGLEPQEPRKPCVGRNSVPSGAGVVSVGDAVIVKKMVNNPVA